MTQFPDDLDPRLVERLISSGGGELTSKMGITFLKITAEESIATMPVEGNRQVVGILHGGAHVVLAESLGSLSAAVHGGPDRVAVGIEINAVIPNPSVAGSSLEPVGRCPWEGACASVKS